MALPPNPGVNLNVCVAVDMDWVIYYEEETDSFNQYNFEVY